MAVELWINDGNPWYMSPDIWVVPSDNPNDLPGQPIANDPAYVWARVHNRGSTPVANAQVRFYWANPSAVITRTTATLIGTSFVTLADNETKEVLCVTPWVPQYVNRGHECLIVEVSSADDPLPPQAPEDPFNPPGVRQQAQLNLSIVMVLEAKALLLHPLLVTNFRRAREEVVQARVRRAPLSLLGPLRKQMGLKRIPAEALGLEAFGLQPYYCGDLPQDIGARELVVPLPPGHQQGLVLAIRDAGRIKAGSGALFLVEQFQGEAVVGGLGVFVVPEARQPKAKQTRKE